MLKDVRSAITKGCPTANLKQGGEVAKGQHDCAGGRLGGARCNCTGGRDSHQWVPCQWTNRCYQCSCPGPSSTDSDPPSISLGLHFADPANATWAFTEASSTIGRAAARGMYLLENPILHVSFSPFLSALQRLDYRSISPTMMRTIASPTQARSVGGTAAVSSPPAYVSAPTFSWDISLLLQPSAGTRRSIRLKPQPQSIAYARESLHTHGTLDPSQSDAVIAALTSEVALIQGPPGTGKTYTGVQLIRTLLANGAQPIVLMAQINHALDNILKAVFAAEKESLGAKETGIVRLGSGSGDEDVKMLELQHREKKVNFGKRTRETRKVLGCTMRGLESVSWGTMGRR